MATNTSVMEYVAIGQIIAIPSSSNLSFLNLLKGRVTCKNRNLFYNLETLLCQSNECMNFLEFLANVLRAKT